jgi:hypothetical protein
MGGGFTLLRNEFDKDDPMQHEDWEDAHNGILFGEIELYTNVVKHRIPLPGLKMGLKVPRYLFS